MEIDAYVAEYVEIAEKLNSAILFVEHKEAAIAILQERGKDRRQEKISEERKTAPVTQPQIDRMKRDGIGIPIGCTKDQASDLITALEKKNGR